MFLNFPYIQLLSFIVLHCPYGPSLFFTEATIKGDLKGELKTIKTTKGYNDNEGR